MSYAHADTHVICSYRYTCHMLMRHTCHMLMQVHMSYAHADTHLICSLRYTCQLLTCWAAQCYAQADTRPSCLLAGLLDAMLMQIHVSAAYLLGCARCWSEDRVRSPRGSKPTSKTCDRGLRSDRYSATACILLAVVLATLCICSLSCRHHMRPAVRGCEQSVSFSRLSQASDAGLKTTKKSE